MNPPKEFLERMKKMLGREYDAFLSSCSQPSTMGIRFNPLKKQANHHLPPIPWAKNGYYYTSDFTPGKSVLHDIGLYYIQEPSAMSVAEILDPKPHDIVLDLCASPGGKSTQIATLMQNSGLLISNEIIPKRAQVLADNISRMGITNTVVLNETPENVAKKFSGFFDKILVDAPCSGEGMFRKNPEVINEWSEENVKMCATRQLSILNTIKSALKFGGEMVYSTCTFSAEEDEMVVEQFLQENPDFELVEISNPLFSQGIVSNTKTSLTDITKTARLFPHKLNGEGHFVAKFRKVSESENTTKPLKSNIEKSSEKALLSFLKNTEISLNEGILLDFKGHIYLLSPLCKNMDKLKIQQAGLYLGEVDKNKNFIPSHNLALALNIYGIKTHTSKHIDLTETELKTYISGATLNTGENITGWTLLTYDGNPVGWGKVSSGVIKNHYPKYLRRQNPII